jgi:hypothetical protein
MIGTLSRQQVVSLSQSSCVSPFELTDGREGKGMEPNHTLLKNPPDGAGPNIQADG